MFWDHMEEKKTLENSHAVERPLLIKSGVSVEKIDALHQKDCTELNSDRAFYRKLEAYESYDSEVVSSESDFDARLDWLDTIDNPVLLEAL